MRNFLTKIVGDKKDWRAMEARANALPRDHRIIYGEMKSCMWRFTAGDGMDVIGVLKGVLELFEASAEQGKNALDVTGQDVAAFCHERLRATTSYLDEWRVSLNRDIAMKLAQ